jgi:hypothetical protein
MKSSIIKALVMATVAFCWAPLHAEDSKQVAYGPTVVTLTGVIIEEAFGEDASTFDRGRHVRILRLDQTISVPAKPGDEIDTEEKNVKEVHLVIDHAKHPIPKNAFGKTHFTATGTLYHAHTVHHLRPIVMLVSDLKPARTKAKHD